MKYRLRDEVKCDYVAQVLRNRGIDDLNVWANASWDEIYDYGLLDMRDIARGINLLQGTIERDENIFVVVDSDVDGYSSASLFINFLYKLYPLYTSTHVKWGLHESKAHGLADMMEQIGDEISLVVIPDAGSSDYTCQDALVKSGKRVLILDHHEAPGGKNKNPDVVTINNQLCDYPDKSLTGVGITWQFCRAYEDNYTEQMGFERADSFMDLVAFGVISDMADFRDNEVRAIVNIGLRKFKNPFLRELSNQNEFTMSKYGGKTYKGVAFGMTPFVNAICRSGTAEEKDLVFKAMLDMYDQTFMPSGKRGEHGLEVPVYQEAVRVALNVKARQTKEQNSAIEVMEDRINDSDSVICVVCSADEARPELCGLIANKLQSDYNKPAFVLIDYPDEGVCRGSARNASNSPIDDLRQSCEDSGIVSYAAGHSSAFGVQMKEEDVPSFVKFFNDIPALASNDSKEHLVDFIWRTYEVPTRFFTDIDECQDFWGQQMPEPLVVIEDIQLSNVSVQLLSPDKNPTLKITLPTGVQLLKFKSSQEECDSFTTVDKNQYLTVMGTCSVNHWNGNSYPQVLVQDYEVVQDWIF